VSRCLRGGCELRGEDEVGGATCVGQKVEANMAAPLQNHAARRLERKYSWKPCGQESMGGIPP